MDLTNRPVRVDLSCAQTEVEYTYTFILFCHAASAASFAASFAAFRRLDSASVRPSAPHRLRNACLLSACRTAAVRSMPHRHTRASAHATCAAPTLAAACPLHRTNRGGGAASERRLGADTVPGCASARARRVRASPCVSFGGTPARIPRAGHVADSGQQDVAKSAVARWQVLSRLPVARVHSSSARSALFAPSCFVAGRQ